MRVLTRYLSTEFLKLFGILLFVFILLYLIFDAVGKAEDFIEADVPFRLMLVFLLAKVPHIALQIMPAAVLIAVIILVGLMQRSNEVMALKGSGLNVFALARPLIRMGVLTALLAFVLSELVVPATSAVSNEIWVRKLNKGSGSDYVRQDWIWYRGEHAIYWITHFDSRNRLMEGVTFYFLGPDFELTRRIDARRAVWNGKQWVLSGGVLQCFDPEGDCQVERFDQMAVDLKETPADFMRTRKRPEEMNYWQLKAFAQRIQDEGYDATAFRVACSMKLAFPLVNTIMLLLGISIALRVRRSTVLAVAVGLGVCFFYLFALGFGRSLGLSGLLPPALAAWAANLVFGLIGIYLLMRVEA